MSSFNPLDPLGIFTDGESSPSHSQTDAMIERRRSELLAKGFPEGVVSMGMTWARNSAEGMAGYYSPGGENFDTLFKQFLERYLADVEKYITSLVGEPAQPDAGPDTL